MHKILFAVAAMTMAFAASPSQASDDVPNIVGTWPCDDATALLKGTWTDGVQRTLEITEQKGASFTGMWNWAVNPDHGVKGEHGGELTHSSSVPLLGVFGWDNQTLNIVAHGDTHLQQWQLANDDTMEIVAFKSGDHAWVGRVICRRGNN